MDNIIMGLNIMLIVLVVIIIGLVIAYYFLVYKSKVNEEERNKQKEVKSANKEFNGIQRETTDKILDFDEVRDDMIIRKNRQQYIMVIQCKGINYDLLSEEEKEAVERGFVEFLNTIRKKDYEDCDIKEQKEMIEAEFSLAPEYTKKVTLEYMDILEKVSKEIGI